MLWVDERRYHHKHVRPDRGRNWLIALGERGGHSNIIGSLPVGSCCSTVYSATFFSLLMMLTAETWQVGNSPEQLRAKQK